MSLSGGQEAVPGLLTFSCRSKKKYIAFKFFYSFIVIIIFGPQRLSWNPDPFSPISLDLNSMSRSPTLEK